MKQLLIAALFFSACTDQKNDIVEKQKKLNSEIDSLILVNHKVNDRINSIRQPTHNQDIKKVYTESKSFTSNPEEGKTMDSLLTILNQTHEAVVKLNKQYDSLEIELK